MRLVGGRNQWHAFMLSTLRLLFLHHWRPARHPTGPEGEYLLTDICAPYVARHIRKSAKMQNSTSCQSPCHSQRSVTVDANLVNDSLAGNAVECISRSWATAWPRLQAAFIWRCAAFFLYLPRESKTETASPGAL